MTLEDLALMVGRIDAKLDGLLALSGRVGAVETRVASIEGWNTKLLALGGAIGAGVTVAFQFIPEALKSLKGA